MKRREEEHDEGQGDNPNPFQNKHNHQPKTDETTNWFQVVSALFSMHHDTIPISSALTYQVATKPSEYVCHDYLVGINGNMVSTDEPLYGDAGSRRFRAKTSPDAISKVAV